MAPGAVSREKTVQEYENSLKDLPEYLAFIGVYERESATQATAIHESSVPQLRVRNIRVKKRATTVTEAIVNGTKLPTSISCTRDSLKYFWS